MIHSRPGFFKTACVLFAVLASSLPSSADELKVRFKTSPRDSVEISGLDTAGVTYVCLNDLAEALRLASSVNDTLRKLEIRVSTRRIKFTRNNPFLVVTDVPTNASSVYQLPNSTVQRGEKYYAPLLPFVSFFDRMWEGGVSIDSASLTVSLGSFDDAPEFDITGVSVERKSNGYLIIIHALKKFGEVEAWLKPDGWLFVTIANAKADTFALSRTRLFGAIRNLLTFQSPTSPADLQSLSRRCAS